MSECTILCRVDSIIDHAHIFIAKQKHLGCKNVQGQEVMTKSSDDIN